MGGGGVTVGSLDGCDFTTLVTNKNIIMTYFNITCGASDWHNLVGGVTKLHMQKRENTIITYRSYKKFKDDDFQYHVSCIPFHVTEVFDDIDDQYWAYCHLLSNILDDHAPLKQRTIKQKQVPYMNSVLSAPLNRNKYRI